ncbi:MAG TPA: 30S ribosomal protein S6 [Thermoleophilaceae bacterium]|nr:30S ribosomal protein S6 [Thermoleophilaceae bacterium]
MSPLYDLVILLDPNAPDERREEIMAGVRSMIEASGTLVGEHDWGTRRMAYEIDKRPDAEYRLLQMEAEPELLDQLRHQLKITDGVLRSRTIRLKPGAPPPPPSPEGAIARAGHEDDASDTQVAPRAAADA